MEKWPDGHIKYTGDLNQSFDTAANDLTSLFQALGAAWIAGDVAKAMQITQQLKNQGATNAQIASVKAAALTTNTTTNARAAVAGKAIDAGAPINPITVTPP